MNSIYFLDLTSASREEGMRLFNLLLACQQVISNPIDILIWLQVQERIVPLRIVLVPMTDDSSRLVRSRHEPAKPSDP